MSLPHAATQRLWQSLAKAPRHKSRGSRDGAGDDGDARDRDAVLRRRIPGGASRGGPHCRRCQQPCGGGARHPAVSQSQSTGLVTLCWQAEAEAEAAAPPYCLTEEVKMVLVVRSDLGMTKGKMCAQVGAGACPQHGHPPPAPCSPPAPRARSRSRPAGAVRPCHARRLRRGEEKGRTGGCPARREPAVPLIPPHPPSPYNIDA
jgi:hypothetical protein